MTCPKWLKKRLDENHGTISFYSYMDLALNDPEFGAYATGHLRIGKNGDFITSPSLGPEFAELLAIQLIDWFKQIIEKFPIKQKLSLIDIGPGEGDLSRDLILSLWRIEPKICKKINLILVEKNQGMAKRQKQKLKSISFVPITWMSLEELQDSPVFGIVLAHELLDALPVERIVYRNNSLFRQGVSSISKDNSTLLKFVELPLSRSLEASIKEICNSFNIQIPPTAAAEGWSSEWHISLKDWFENCSKILRMGIILVIDYTLDARSYYNSIRSSGTLLAYRSNKSSSDILSHPGLCDLTSHLCFETLDFYAKNNGFQCLGKVSQSLALLSLGLAKKIHSLKFLDDNKISAALEKRENLLRLVEPSGLGSFSWIAYQINNHSSSYLILDSLFLKEPID